MRDLTLREAWWGDRAFDLDSFARRGLVSRVVREATGGGWNGQVVRMRSRPSSFQIRDGVTVRFVVDGCGASRRVAAACATLGGYADDGGGQMHILVDDSNGCRVRFYTRIQGDELFVHELGHTLGFSHPDGGTSSDEMSSGSYNGRAGFSGREQDYMQHAYKHGRGFRLVGGRHVEGPPRPAEPVWIID